MAVLGSATYKLSTDNTKLNKGLADAEKNAKSKMQAIGQHTRAIGLVGVGVGAALLAPLALAGKQASNLVESINAVEVVFDHGSHAILRFSKTAARSIGLARSDFNQLSAVTGAFLRNFGLDANTAAEKTIVLATRAADLASVFNTDVPDALNAINAALRGETEQIRKYGADVSDATLQTYLLTKGIDGNVAGAGAEARAVL